MTTWTAKKRKHRMQAKLDSAWYFFFVLFNNAVDVDEIHISEQPTHFTTVHGTAVTASCSGGRWPDALFLGAAHL